MGVGKRLEAAATAMGAPAGSTLAGACTRSPSWLSWSTDKPVAVETGQTRGARRCPAVEGRSSSHGQWW